MSNPLRTTLNSSVQQAPKTVGQQNKNADKRSEAEQLARLVYRIYKESYPKIKVGGNKNAK